MALGDLEDLWQVLIWGFVTTVLYILFARTWNRKTYKFLRSHQVMLVEWLHFLITATLLLSIAYAAWRIWDDGDWDVHPGHLFVYILFVIVFSLTIPALFWVGRSLQISLIWSVVTFLFALATMILFFTVDLFAGIIMIFMAAFTLYWMIINFLLVWNPPDKDAWEKFENEATMTSSTTTTTITSTSSSFDDISDSIVNYEMTTRKRTTNRPIKMRVLLTDDEE